MQGLLHLAKRELFKLSKQFSVIEMTQINIILAPCNSTIDVTLLAFSLWIDGHKIFLLQASRVSCKATSSHFALPFFFTKSGRAFICPGGEMSTAAFPRPPPQRLLASHEIKVSVLA